MKRDHCMSRWSFYENLIKTLLNMIQIVKRIFEGWRQGMGPIKPFRSDVAAKTRIGMEETLSGLMSHDEEERWLSSFLLLQIQLIGVVIKSK
jgi:hypothetical protein